ncbi:hypothetical protein BH20VER1_BH20VER1_29870 [soil metagenome]
MHAGSRLRNLSTRGRVGQGDDVLIGGFITRGGQASRYIIRAIGPSLAAAGVGMPLADPVLTVFDENGQVIATNDNFATSANAAEINAIGLAPNSPNEAAVLVTVTPTSATRNGGLYTAQVTGKGGATGVALVEVYELP